MTGYASKTEVPIERTRSQIEQLVVAKGAGQFMSAANFESGRAIVGWTSGGRMVRLAVPLPSPKEDRFIHRRTRHGFSWRTLPTSRQRELWEQACRSRWRAVLLIVKAKFEAIDAGVSTFEREFLADTVMADGQTIGEWVAPQLESMYATGRMPLLLPGLGESSANGGRS